MFSLEIKIKHSFPFFNSVIDFEGGGFFGVWVCNAGLAENPVEKKHEGWLNTRDFNFSQ